MTPDFRFDESFQVKTGSFPTKIVDPSFRETVIRKISRKVWKIIKFVGVYLVGKDTFLSEVPDLFWWEDFGFWSSQTCADITLSGKIIKLE